MNQQLWIGALIGAGGTLLGAIIGGLLNYLNTRQQLKYQRAKETRDLRRTKLEELVVKIEKTSACFSGAITYLLSVKPPEKVDQDKLVGATPLHAELMMLTLIYAPELSAPYSDAIRLSQNFGEQIEACRRRIDKGERLCNGDAQVEILFQKEDELLRALASLSQQVATLAKKCLDEQTAGLVKPKH